MKYLLFIFIIVNNLNAYSLVTISSVWAVESYCIEDDYTEDGTIYTYERVGLSTVNTVDTSNPFIDSVEFDNGYDYIDRDCVKREDENTTSVVLNEYGLTEADTGLVMALSGLFTSTLLVFAVFKGL